MFEAVSWSTASTLSETEASFAAVGYNTTLVETWYDVDEPNDVVRLADDPGAGPKVSAWLEGNSRLIERIRAGESPA